MNHAELRRLIVEELRDCRELKREDSAIASRILDALAEAGALDDGDGWDYE